LAWITTSLPEDVKGVEGGEAVEGVTEVKVVQVTDGWPGRVARAHRPWTSNLLRGDDDLDVEGSLQQRLPGVGRGGLEAHVVGAVLQGDGQRPLLARCLELAHGTGARAIERNADAKDPGQDPDGILGGPRQRREPCVAGLRRALPVIPRDLGDDLDLVI